MILQLLSVLIVGLGTLGQSLFGFGGGLIIVPLVGLLVGIKTSVSVALLLQIGMGLLVIPTFKDIDWKASGYTLVGLLPFTGLGLWMYESFSEWTLRLILMIFIGLFLINKLLLPKLRLFGTGPVWSVIAGGMAGILQGVLGTGGPPLVMLLTERKMDKTSFRATIMFLLFSTNIIRLAVSFQRNLFSPQAKTLALWSLPIFLLALVLGQKWHSGLSEKTYQWSVYTLLGVSFISLGVKLFG